MTEDYNFTNTKAWADYIVNNFGCNDLKLQYMYLNANGDVIATPRASYWMLVHKGWNEPVGFWNLTVKQFFSKANNCSGIDILVPLDFDEGSLQEYLELIARLEEEGYSFIAYAAGNRCRHIHLFFPKLRVYSLSRRKEFKHYVIKKCFCDAVKASDSQNIPVCYPSPEGFEIKHWKTGQAIKVVMSNV